MNFNVKVNRLTGKYELLKKPKQPIGRYKVFITSTKTPTEKMGGC